MKPREKGQIIRDYLIQHPDIKRYGYLKTIVEIFEKKGVKICPSGVSHWIDKIKRDWADDIAVKFTKKQAIDYLHDLYEQATSVTDKRLILTEFLKIEGLYAPEVKKVELKSVESFNDLIESEMAGD